jgi:hypothetical protein
MSLYEVAASELGGANCALLFQDKRDAVLAINHLATCKAHGGIHHFAVFGEGRCVAMSETGVECVKASFTGRFMVCERDE